MQKLKRILLGLIFTILTIIIMAYLFQEKIIFQPEKLSQNYTYDLSEPFREIFLDASDGGRLNAIHFKKANPKGVIVYFHGNKGSLKRWAKITSYFANKGYDVIVMDYRTYGKSTGTLTEENLYTDAQLFYDYALKSYPENGIIVYGRSLGTGIATKIASLNAPGKLILETPYYNMTDVVKYWVPVLPLESILKYKFSTDEYIKQVSCKIIIYHGTADGVVPYASGKKLFESIPSKNKRMISIEGGSHNDLVNFEGYTATIDTILEVK